MPVTVYSRKSESIKGLWPPSARSDQAALPRLRGRWNDKLSEWQGPGSSRSGAPSGSCGESGHENHPVHPAADQVRRGRFGLGAAVGLAVCWARATVTSTEKLGSRCEVATAPRENSP